MLYTIITLNGRAFQFEADNVEETQESYVFYLDGEIVAQFLIKGISGYFAMETVDEDE